MIIVAVCCLAAGILAGRFVATGDMLAVMGEYTRIFLYASIFFAGIQIGMDKEVIGKVKALGFKVLFVPLGVIIGSIGAGLLMGPILHMPVNASTAVTSGMGWYSLSAVLLKDLGGAQLGTTAFLANIFREVLSLIITAAVAKYCGHFAAIAPAGATAMDSCLPAITKATNQATAVVALISGVVCTAVIPVLVPLAYQLLQ